MSNSSASAADEAQPATSYSGDGGGEPVGHQRRDHLAVGQLGPTLHRRHPIDHLDEVQPLQVMPHEQQGTDLPAGPHGRRVEPGERRRQLVQLARRLQHVLAAERMQQPVPDLPSSVRNASTSRRYV